MGTSASENIPFVVRELRRTRPRLILDVGIGFGKWGVLAREYLDAWEGRNRREEWIVRIEGIEAFDGYRNPVWDAVYDAVHIGRAEEVLEGLGDFDVGIICDVIEHLEKPTGKRLLAQMVRKCATVILTTPLSFWPQGEENGNPDERHLCLWQPGDFEEYSGFSEVLGATFGAVIQQTETAARKPFRQLHRLVYEGVRPLLRGAGRRLLLKMKGSAPERLQP